MCLFECHFCPPQFPLRQTWVRNRTSAVIIRRLIFQVMSLSSVLLLGSAKCWLTSHSNMRGQRGISLLTPTRGINVVVHGFLTSSLIWGNRPASRPYLSVSSGRAAYVYVCVCVCVCVLTRRLGVSQCFLSTVWGKRSLTVCVTKPRFPGHPYRSLAAVLNELL
jgi:hypothetical protein